MNEIIESKIIEEAKKYYKNDINCYNAFLHGVEWCEDNVMADSSISNTKSPWISTDKYLPRNGGHYLCNDGDNHISTLAFCGDRWFNSRTFNDIPLEVVKYWMPIPKLPKE